MVSSLNRERRPMNESQRALAGAKWTKLGVGRPRPAGPTAEAEGTAAAGSGRPVRPKGEPPPIGAGVSQAEAAQRMNVSRRSLQRAAAIQDDPDLAAAVERGQVTVADAFRVREEPADVKRRAVEAVEAGQARTLARAVERIKGGEANGQAIAQDWRIPPYPDVRVAPVDKLKTRVVQGTIDIIATSPPAEQSGIRTDVYKELAQFAVHALRPGGVLLARAPSGHLPAVLKHLSVEELKYCWIIALHQLDPPMQVSAQMVNSTWQPWLVYTRKGKPRRPDRYSADYFAATGGEEAARAALEAMIRHWAEPGGELCDPYCGAGAVLVAGWRAELWVGGADIDPGNVELSRQALKAEEKAVDEALHRAYASLRT